MHNIVYIKKIDDYDEMINNKIKIPLLFKKLVLISKYFFNRIIKKNKNGYHIWLLPFYKKIPNNKIEKIINQQIKKKYITKNTKLVIANNLNASNIANICNQYHIDYFKGYLIKKLLVLKTIEYINNLQNKEFNERNVTILVNENNDINANIIMNIALKCKTIKIVSKKIYKFKKLEEKLYNHYGIAIQFSNSIKKSLVKSDMIINLDFSELEVNEYQINNHAIIINTVNYLKIKSKIFNGIIINSCNIKFLEKLKNQLIENNLLNKFDNLILYESIINWKNINNNVLEEINKNMKIINLIGNNGVINNKEFNIVNEKY